MIFKNSKDKNLNINLGKSQRYTGFTLAEVLITLGIIGVVAAISIPSLLGIYKETQYKTAYKKAFSEVYQAFKAAQYSEEFSENSNDSNTLNNFNLIKHKFKVVKSCSYSVADGCWVESCIIEKDCFWCYSASPNLIGAGFIDASGRSWVHYAATSDALVILVDTNGFSSPNRMGRDRFPFIVRDKSGGLYGLPYSINVYSDIIAKDEAACSLGNCYYQSWIYN